MLIPGFSFSTATKIVFGRGSSKNAVDEIRRLGHNVLLVTGANQSRANWLRDQLKVADGNFSELAIQAEPNVQTIEQGAEKARTLNSNVVVSLGGGSAIDAGKAIAALATSDKCLMDHLEVVGLGKPLVKPPLPFVAIPTTAGTGAEVTKNAVIDVPDKQRKVSLRDEKMFANLAIIDPALTDNTPKAVTLSCGLDALTQVIEPYLCSRHNPFTDALALSAIETGLNALVELMDNENSAARDRICWTSLCGGIALANSGLGAVHGLAGPLGGMSNVAHGKICGALLPSSLKLHSSLLADGEYQERMALIENVLASTFETEILEAIDALSNWADRNGQRGLNSLGITDSQRIRAATEAQASSSMKSNPVQLSVEQLGQLMEDAR